MTAAELIAELQKLPPETVVLVSGQEGGYDDLEGALVVHTYVRDFHSNPGYLGRHDRLSCYEDPRDFVLGPRHFKGVAIL